MTATVYRVGRSSSWDLRHGMNESLFRELLFDSESSRLDFKRDPYPFVDASDEQKSALLKDLLAFANAWRSETAYIVIGVEHRAGEDPDRVGVDPSAHVDEASLQQFVASKTVPPLKFTYYPFTYEGKQFGIFEIPRQSRPVVAKRRYGRVGKEVVYFRRGSGCAEATPGEIAQMGRDDAAAATNMGPRLELVFADAPLKRIIGTYVAHAVVLHVPHRNQDYPDEVEEQQGALDFGSMIWEINRAYWRTLATYVRERRRFAAVGFAVHNVSAAPAQDVKVVLTCDARGVEFRDVDDLPDRPRHSWNRLLLDGRPLPETRRRERFGVPEVRPVGSSWEIVIGFGLIRPGEIAWTEDPLCVAPAVSGRIAILARAFASNISRPIEVPLFVDATVRARPKLRLEVLKRLNESWFLARLREAGHLRPSDEDSGAETDAATP